MSGQGRATLADIDFEGGAADRAGKRTGDRFAARCGRRRNDEAHRSGGGIGLAGLAQQQQRPAGVLRPRVQPPRGGEVEPLRTAADLEDDRCESGHAGGLLGDPQRVEQLRRLGKQQLLRLDAEQGVKAPGIGKAGLVKNFRRADPEDRQALLLLEDQAHERQREASDGAGIAGLQSMDLAERGLGQAAAEGGVEAIDAGVQEGVRRGHGKAAPDKRHVRSADIVGYSVFRNSGRKTASHFSWNCSRHARRRRLQALGQRSLDLRDLAAQGKNSVPRHGAHRHDVHFRQQLFLLCSYRFQRAPEESSGVTRNLFLILYLTYPKFRIRLIP